jgi:hypothetical protein
MNRVPEIGAVSRAWGEARLETSGADLVTGLRPWRALA